MEWAAAVLAWGLSALLTLRYVRRGWVPHDEGTIAHSAERVLLGELPHRDFADVYSGGLSFLHALAFRLLGANLLTPRVVLFACFLLWVPALWWIARRFVGPWGAAAATLLAVAWGPANYFAALPSWYNLFFATWATVALLRFLDTGALRWLFAAGACAGLSLLAKLTGIFLLAAGLLFLVFEEPHRHSDVTPPPGRRGTRAFRLFVAAGLAVFVLAVFRLVRSQPAPATWFHFLAPAAALALLALWREHHRPGSGEGAERIRRLLRLGAPFLAGAALPVSVFLLPFLAAGAVDDLLHGVFVLPAIRATEAATPLPPVRRALLAALPPLVFLLAAHRWRLRASALVAAGASLATALLLAPREPWLYMWLFSAARAAVPVVVLVGCAALAGGTARGRTWTLHERRVLALLIVVALASLVQFPFAAPVYFCYIAPLAVLAATALWSLRPARSRTAAALVVAFSLALAVGGVNRGFIYTMGIYIQPDGYTSPLPMARGGGIRALPSQAAGYARLVEVVRARNRSGFLYAGPDAPELYFLSGLRNPTRSLYEFFDDPAAREARLLRSIDRLGIEAVIVNERPEFSAPLSPGLRAELVARFPRAEPVGPFTVLSRE